MFSAIGKLLKIVIILIAIIIGIAFFTGTEISFSDEKTSSAAPISESNEQCESGYYKNSSKADCIKVPENALSVDESWYCKSGYYKNKTKTTCLKVPENATKYSGADAWYCNSGYIKSSTNEAIECIKRVKEDSSSISNKIPENAYATALESRGWKCKYGYKVSGNSCIKVASSIKESTKKVTTTKSKPDKWWEKTKKYQICYGNVTAAHKANGLHTRNRDKSIEIKEQLCKIAATSTTGEGSFWLK